MKRCLHWCVPLALVLSGCTGEHTVPVAPPAAVASISSADADAEGRHLVVFASEAIPSDFAERVARLGGSVERVHAPIGAATVLGLSDAAASELLQASDVSFVEPDAIVQWIPEQPDLEVLEVSDVGPASPENPASAFFYPRQWHLRQIAADRAWASGRRGSPAVRVAILDTGIDYLHADLQGLVDLSSSRSFVPSDDALLQSRFPGRHAVTDMHWHGTHVAATVSSNAVAAAGVTSGVTLIGVKVLAWTGRGSTSGVLNGIMYASDVGAHVINMSLGSTFRKSAFPGFIASINRAITYANRQGSAVVVSAGNDNADLDHDEDSFKAYCNAPLVVCVSATGPTARASVNGPWTDPDAKAPYSNYGRSAITVAAPGGNVGFVTAACSGASLQIPVCQTGTFVVGANGTSMAAPHTTGVAALLAERHGRNPGRIGSALQQTADDLGEPGADPIYGNGRINAARAVGLD